MRYEPNRLDFEMRTEALSQAISYCNVYGGDVLVLAEDFYLFLANKPQPSSNAPMTTNNFNFGATHSP